MERHRGATPSHDDGAWKEAFHTTNLFGPLSEREFAMEQVVDETQLVARVLSVSFMAALPAGEQATVAHEVSQLAHQYGEPVVLRYTTRAYWCEAWPDA